jgi:Uma2 family endonuclease
MIIPHLTTADDLWKIPRGRDRRELVRGELKIEPLAGAIHGIVSATITSSLHQFVTKHQLGLVVGTGIGFQIATDPDTVRAPDAAFIRRARIPSTKLPERYWPGAPDLAVEVVSAGDTVEELDEKVADWLNAGSLAVWIVKPKTQTVTVYSAPSVLTVLTADDEIDGGDLLPGFRYRVADVFAP